MWITATLFLRATENSCFFFTFRIKKSKRNKMVYKETISLKENFFPRLIKVNIYLILKEIFSKKENSSYYVTKNCLNQSHEKP